MPLALVEEKMTIARWIDLGCPINSGEETGNDDFGWYLDDLRPVLTVTAPRRGWNGGLLTQVLFGMADAYKGLDLESLSVTANFGIRDRDPGAELADLVEDRGAGIYALPLDEPIRFLSQGRIHVEVADNQGNVTRVDRAFTVNPTRGTTRPVPASPIDPSSSR